MKNLISWVEIPAKDMKRAVSFYNHVFGMDLEILDFGIEKMACFPGGEGAISQAKDFNPSDNGVLVSLNTGDQLEAHLQRVEEKGGRILVQKTKIEAENRDFFAIFLDSEGNRLGFYGK